MQHSPYLTQKSRAMHRWMQAFPLLDTGECHLKDYPLCFPASPQRRKDSSEGCDPAQDLTQAENGWERSRTHFTHLYHPGCPTTPAPAPFRRLPVLPAPTFLLGQEEAADPSQPAPHQAVLATRLAVLGIWHIHTAFRLLFVLHSETDPLEAELRACSSGARMRLRLPKICS